ncbi:CTTNBP2 N-terminal-like protein isoform X2 [Anabrus simplex]|uniref:CTTNBP2 N-terminal-like protein isoform X2 n=1 Tax=Anabrus simplex TaxID=316456 RepID=UPI0035A2BA59
MASNANSPKTSSQGISSKSPQHQQQAQTSNFEPLDKSSSNTLKRNPKMELSKSDLLKLLSYLEAELQARDVVIATLKSEKVKQLLNQGRYQMMPANDPFAALQRDCFAAAEPRVDEAEVRAVVNHQLAALDNLVMQQRRAQIRLGRILKEAEERHRKVVQELEEEKRKHEHDTAQGDDITYGLEKERTRLKQELELEKQSKKKLEKDLKKLSDILDEERSRQKQIVLLLLAERKKIIMKYIEERKRSEDLAQILTEEKSRIDSMAEGLEEESKKSLQMEAELEKQLAQFDIEKQQLKAAISKEEKRVKDLESELQKAKAEADSFKKQLAEAHQVAMFQAGTVSISPPRMALPRPSIAGTPPQPPAKPAVIPPQTTPRPGSAQAPPGVPLTPKACSWGPTDGSISPPPPPAAAGTPMMSSVAKVVQPTATVSSVPVCGPTTGIARSVSPGQGLRHVMYSPTTTTTITTTTATTIESRIVASWTSAGTGFTATVSDQVAQVAEKRTPQPQVVQVTPRVSLSASPGTKLFTTTQGNKLTVHVTTNAGTPQSAESTSAAAAAAALPQPPPKKPTPPGRGIPPPIPPNKPVVPPKKEVVTAARRPDVSLSTDIVPAEGKPQKIIAGPAALKFGTNITKDKHHVPSSQPGDLVDGRRDPQVGSGPQVLVEEPSPTPASARNGTTEAARPASVESVPLPPNVHESASAPVPGQGLEMLGQELADFQQMLVSMATDIID